jgi:Spy/CpxP family protein refolding chaperone
MKKIILAVTAAVGLLTATATAADARPWHHGWHHHRHCVSWGWHHHHHDRFCRRWGW